MMVEVRPLTVKDMQSAIRLSDKTFRDSEQKSMGEAFPFMFSKGLIGQSFGAFIDGKLVSFMGLVPSVIRIGEAQLKVYSLGSVCTDEDFRGQGHASAILEKLLHFLEQTDASLLLVSGDRSLYTRAQCYSFGKIKRFTFNREGGKSGQGTTQNSICEMKESDLLRMTNLANTRSFAYEQSVADLGILLKAEAYASCLKLTHKVLVYEEEGEITSFLVAGVPFGSDQNRNPIAVEYAGQPEEITALLSYALQAYGLEKIEVPVPWHQKDLLAELGHLAYKDEQNQGTIKIIQPERLVQELQPYLRNKNNDSIKLETLSDGSIEIITPGARETLDFERFISLIFNPNENSVIHKSLKEELGEVFPLPFPYTAGLNYA
jgi:predicted N-acetyltransferase YhbS